MKAGKLIAGASLALVLAGPVSTFAAPTHGSDADKIRISFADLNINNEAGAEVLYRRLQRAAKTVCGVDSIHVLGSVKRVAETKRCSRQALDEFVGRIDSAALKKIHAS